MNKGSGTAVRANPVECCMCGDAGFSQELIQCKVCHFRSQHRYCSNLYPKSEDYRICNWCLSQKEDSKRKSPNSPNSSPSCRTNSGVDEQTNNRKTYKCSSSPENHVSGKKGEQSSISNNPIKKKSPPETESSPPPVTLSSRKRIITHGRLEEKLLRTKSEEISRKPVSVIAKPVFRNKVKRYKLLEEVSS